MNKRLFGGRDYDYQYKPTDFYLDEKAMKAPLHWRKPRTVFVCSMCDLFHEGVASYWQFQIMKIINHCPQHIFLLLTKRPWLADFPMKEWAKSAGVLPNLHLGVTVCNQEEADRNIPTLLSIPVAHRFISVEPMLGPMNLSNYIDRCPRSERIDGKGHSWVFDGDDPYVICAWCKERRDAITGRIIGPKMTLPPGLDGVICGGETGPGARPMHPDWVRSLRDQCIAADVPFHFKQWGEFEYLDYYHEDDEEAERFLDRPRVQVLVPNGLEWSEDLDGQPPVGTVVYARVGKKKAGRILDGRTWDQTAWGDR